jgi:hypothetical protein
MSVNLTWQVVNLRVIMAYEIRKRTRLLNTGTATADFELFIEITNLVSAGCNLKKDAVAEALMARGDDGIKEYGEETYSEALLVAYDEFERAIAPANLEKGIV